MEIDAESFVGVKGFKAKGKRVAVWQVEHVEELEPLRKPEPDPAEAAEESGEPTTEPVADLDPDAGKSQQQVIDEMTGQLNLFNDIDNKLDDAN